MTESLEEHEQELVPAYVPRREAEATEEMALPLPGDDEGENRRPARPDEPKESIGFRAQTLDEVLDERARTEPARDILARTLLPETDPRYLSTEQALAEKQRQDAKRRASTPRTDIPRMTADSYPLTAFGEPSTAAKTFDELMAEVEAGKKTMEELEAEMAKTSPGTSALLTEAELQDGPRLRNQ